MMMVSTQPSYSEDEVVLFGKSPAIEFILLAGAGQLVVSSARLSCILSRSNSNEELIAAGAGAEGANICV